MNRQIVLISLCLMLLMASTSVQSQQQYCKIDKPTILVDNDNFKATISFACRNSPAKGFIPYPEKIPLYLGMTLYNLDNSGKSSRVRDDGLMDGYLDLPAIDVKEVKNASLFTFETKIAAKYTHFLVVLWDEKKLCSEYEERQGCELYKYVYGRSDHEKMPFPVDSFPRPDCDVKALIDNGFFEWTINSDPSGREMDEKYEDDFRSSDCWILDEDVDYGLGFSVRSWNLAPLFKN